MIPPAVESTNGSRAPAAEARSQIHGHVAIETFRPHGRYKFHLYITRARAAGGNVTITRRIIARCFEAN